MGGLIDGVDDDGGGGGDGDGEVGGLGEGV